jgi:pyruvate-formate lyase-activating enzyme
MVYATAAGEIKDLPDLEMAGRSGREFVRPALADLIPLPEGSDLFVLPGRLPVGFDPISGEPLLVEQDPENSRGEIQAVAAFMAPAHTATLWAAFAKKEQGIPPLPLFAYTAVGWHKDRFWVSAFRSDPDRRQEAGRHEYQKMVRRTNSQLKKYPKNRLIQHLGKCCLTYRCPAAINYFMTAWEAPLPTSPICNAACIGCISLQPSGCCPSTQDRIQFVPSPQEITEIAVPHLQKVKQGVVSFGQGCEGEPLLQAATIEKAITLIRKNTDRGTINLNSNASLPQAVDKLAEAGLDSIRVSMNSARKEYHARYYRPKGFDLDAVKESIRTMKNRQKFVSLNYFILPGFTDDPEEFTALCDLLEKHAPDFIQLRNLNMDPDWYLEAVEHQPAQKPMGIRLWLHELKKRFPRLRFGYFNPPIR